ncbi:unnamed protein product [Auanema sp. JU1783]|nr:unnamed protein product [Auanema sp. JU1783]
MGGESSKLRHSSSTKSKLPSIRLPGSHSYYDGMYKSVENATEVNRGRAGSASSRGSQQRHPLPLKMRRLIQSCFSNPHELVGRRVMKRACDLKPEFGIFYMSMEASKRDDFENDVKIMLKKVVTNIDFVDEVQRHSEEFGAKFAELRSLGFRPDFFAVLADATIQECTHLDSAVHKAHTTTHAFSQFGAMIFSSVRDGFYGEVRRIRRTSNSFSSNGSQRVKKRSIDSTADPGSFKGSSRGNSPRTSISRGCSPRSCSPESQISDECFITADIQPEDDGFLKPPTMNMVTTRSY